MGRWPHRPVLATPAAKVLAVAVLAALVPTSGCTVRVRPEPPASRGTAAPATTASTAAATARGSTVALRAFVVERVWAGGPVRPAPAGPLPVAMRCLSELQNEATNTVLVFPLLRAPPRCVRQVELWLRVLRFDRPAAVIAAYPSRMVSLATDRPATRIGSETLVDNRPRGTGTLTDDGTWLHFDVTELYRTWAEGGPFPSRLRTVEPGTPLVLDIRPEALAEPYFEARFAPLGPDRERAPQLRWRVTRDC